MAAKRKEIPEEQKITADRLYNIRIQLGYTQAQFAKILDVAYSTYKKIEKGESGITVRHLRRLNKYLGISAEYMLLGDRTKMDETWLNIQDLSEKDKMRIFLRLYTYMKENCHTAFREQREWKKQDEQIQDVIEFFMTEAGS